MAKQDLILFTNGFPCVKEGEEFLEAELDLLSAEFRSIIIYVLQEGAVIRKIPANVTVKALKPLSGVKVRSIFLKHGLTILNIYRNDLKDPVAKHAILKNRKFYFNVLIGNFLLKRSMEQELKQYNLNETKLYSYWCGPWFDILMLMNKSIISSITFRAHGYDFDVNQRPDKYIPYRNSLMKKDPFISFISQFGYDTYSSKYPKYTNKKMYRLGVAAQPDKTPEKQGSEFLIVSCSSAIQLKRIDLIVEILKHIPNKVKWIHFGDGPLLTTIKEKAQKELGSNVTVEFKGYVAHTRILQYYSENHVDLFMNVSELEGIPVSIMEAISFGIPVTGCKICGVPEIVTKDTGFLWDVNFDPKEAAKQISNYLEWPLNRKENLRITTKNYWNENFNAFKNYKAFIKDCLLN